MGENQIVGDREVLNLWKKWTAKEQWHLIRISINIMQKNKKTFLNPTMNKKIVKIIKIISISNKILHVRKI